MVNTGSLDLIIGPKKIKVPFHIFYVDDVFISAKPGKTFFIPISKGGLGLRSFVALNEATNLNLGWDLFNLEEPWVVLLRIRVLRKNKTIKHHTFSSIWSSVKNETLLISVNSSWILGNGESIRFWYDNWCGAPLILDMENQVVVVDLRVSSFIIDHKWDFSSNNHDILDSLQVIIRNYHISFDLRGDKRFGSILFRASSC
ncbi:hypothetical protein KIW84_031583 [Lathyrus oleraceus]|uniref:Uncharacterized protein n=1 Tax=Pisum sativum TaxID=3888 RepID=A0A9D4XR04_PEA|nr:hypothetical protein KIW84_031583 [Pisum sativum]